MLSVLCPRHLLGNAFFSERALSFPLRSYLLMTILLGLLFLLLELLLTLYGNKQAGRMVKKTGILVAWEFPLVLTVISYAGRPMG